MTNNDIKSAVDWLMYRSYEHNRRNSPHIPYYKWREYFQDAVTYEEIYDRHMNRINGGENVRVNNTK